MNYSTIVRKAMADNNLTQMALATKLGLKTQAVVSSRLRSEGMRVDNFVEMLNACGYTVEIKNPTGEVEYSFKPEVSSDEKDC